MPRGSIIKVPDSTPGLLYVNGQQKSFTMDGVWKSPVAPAPNMIVEVELDAAGGIIGLTAIDPQQLSKERMQHATAAAQEQGKQVAAMASKGIGAIASRMGNVTLGAAVVIWIAWFFLPAVSLNMFVINQSFTFWRILAIDLNNPLTMGDPNASVGFLGIIGLVAIAAPFAAAYLKFPWAKYLYAAPLVFIALFGLKMWWDISSLMGQAQKEMGGLGVDMSKTITSAFSFGFGLYVLVIAAVVVAARVLTAKQAS